MDPRGSFDLEIGVLDWPALVTGKITQKMGMQIIPASLGDCDNGGEGWARIPGELSIPYRELATVVTLQHLAGMLCLITGGMISCVPVIAPVRATFSSSPFFFFLT